MADDHIRQTISVYIAGHDGDWRIKLAYDILIPNWRIVSKVDF
jgi:hypothetical protein